MTPTTTIEDGSRPSDEANQPVVPVPSLAKSSNHAAVVAAATTGSIFLLAMILAIFVCRARKRRPPTFRRELMVTSGGSIGALWTKYVLGRREEAPMDLEIGKEKPRDGDADGKAARLTGYSKEAEFLDAQLPPYSPRSSISTVLKPNLSTEDDSHSDERIQRLNMELQWLDDATSRDSHTSRCSTPM